MEHILGAVDQGKYLADRFQSLAALESKGQSHQVGLLKALVRPRQQRKLLHREPRRRRAKSKVGKATRVHAKLQYPGDVDVYLEF